MKIFGIGIDIVKNSFILNLSESSLSRIFSKNEMKYCMSKEKPIQHMAGRFACKESIVKALGLPKEFGFIINLIEVMSDENGKPFVKYHGIVDEYMKKNNIEEVIISLSHNDESSIAMAVAVQ